MDLLWICWLREGRDKGGGDRRKGREKEKQETTPVIRQKRYRPASSRSKNAQSQPFPHTPLGKSARAKGKVQSAKTPTQLPQKPPTHAATWTHLKSTRYHACTQPSHPSHTQQPICGSRNPGATGAGSTCFGSQGSIHRLSHPTHLHPARRQHHSTQTHTNPPERKAAGQKGDDRRAGGQDKCRIK